MRFFGRTARAVLVPYVISRVVVVGSLAVCALGCVLAVWLAARIYRVGMLMYGKKPSLAEVAKWVKYA